MRNTGLEEAQARVKIARRNSNNLRYADDITLMAESKEELSLLMNVKEESEKTGLKTQHSKNEDHGIGPNTSGQTDGETMETVIDYFLGPQMHCRQLLQPWN